MRVIGLWLSAVIIALATIPAASGHAAVLKWTVQMRIQVSYDVSVISAHTQGGAWCWASVTYDSGTVRNISMLGEPAGSTGLVVWSWWTSPQAGVSGAATAAVTCTWHGQVRTASDRFGLPTLVSVPSNGSPPLSAPTHSKLIARWTYAAMTAPNLSPGVHFTARGAFDLSVALAPIDPKQIAALQAISILNIYVPRGRIAETGVITTSTLTTQHYHFSAIDCSGGCQLYLQGGTNLNTTLLITQ